MSNLVVVDTSIVVKWVLQEPDSDLAIALLTDWVSKNVAVLAPGILAYEVTNTIYQRVRRNEMDLVKAKQLLTKVIRSEIVLLFSQDPIISVRAIEIAHNYRLSATYDAHYLALAESKGCELWTADTRMYKAVKGQFDWVRSISDYRTS